MEQLIDFRLVLAEWLRPEGRIQLSEWHPPVRYVENFMKGGCYHG